MAIKEEGRVAVVEVLVGKLAWSEGQSNDSLIGYAIASCSLWLSYMGVVYYIRVAIVSCQELMGAAGFLNNLRRKLNRVYVRVRRGRKLISKSIIGCIKK